jgi:hypothetical protein
MTLSREGSLLVQIAEKIQTPVEIVQRELLKRSPHPAMRLDPFLPQLRRARLEEYLTLLHPHGILPLLREDRLLTVLAELPHVAPWIVQLCCEQGLPITWCHVVVIHSQYLLAHVPLPTGAGV